MKTKSELSAKARKPAFAQKQILNFSVWVRLQKLERKMPVRNFTCTGFSVQASLFVRTDRKVGQKRKRINGLNELAKPKKRGALGESSRIGLIG